MVRGLFRPTVSTDQFLVKTAEVRGVARRRRGPVLPALTPGGNYCPGPSWGSEVTPDAGFVGQLKVGIIVNDGFLDSNVMEMMVDVVPSTGIDHADADAVALYPNPCRDYITVIASGRISRVSIINLAGQTIQIENNPQERILVSSLMRGVYLVKIETNDGHDTVMRLVKQ